MTPLTTWTCDTCREEITAPDLGIVVWRADGAFKAYDFKIVHQSGVNGQGGCDPGAGAGYVSNLNLPFLLGENGLAYLLSMLSAGPLKGGGGITVSDLDGFVDLTRRLQTPWYEQARARFGDEDVQIDLADASEVFPYLPETLKEIASH